MIRNHLINKLNKDIRKLWNSKPKPKPDIMKLTAQMLNDPKWKGKVWNPNINKIV